ncbi:choline dehydrogenase [Siccirubricoccus deserti]|uniref:GMC family oxidoreductase N-terminal domain-containing protein n=1 Tax=Siccirubricoccus deserti TaxID=2013562 RepID=A0A9X0R070_9PROT|nr:GMC family oxidoreductase N-terminal domain-containing protein [Siccirubricoccus deserti]MBC4016388.1 GMC family oxidoreductase N-terminal domain-containing protein [Siccirubricoccus deserti]GGC49382.1 choline dehydrogenase [Siccirubricoccus deserti]
MQTYDYIVVGAGSAGAVVANRLSADPRNRVLLLEAGPASHPWGRIPIGYAKMLTNPAVNWTYSAEPEANTNGRRLPVPRGRILGGSSAINGMAFVRGQAQDFDTWAQMGNQGWSYADVLPFFKRMERYEGGGEDAFRGRDGPLRVTNPEPSEPLYATLIKAAGEVGIPHNPDYNGATQDGIAMSQATIAARQRMSTARCYLDPIRQRQNLRIETGALAEALVLEGRRCIGIRYSVAGETREARAGREIVVSAGSINSPQLLELSGIGQPERLRNLGIEVRHALPGVGENLRDHYAPRTRWAIGAKRISFNDRSRGLGMVQQALRYAMSGRGMLGMVAAPIRAFVRSREGLEAPDLLLGWVPMLTEPGPKGPKLSHQSGMTCYAHPMRPESKGHIHIVSADPRRPPAINFNFLSSPVDAELTVRAIRIAQSVMTAPAMAPLQVTEIAPGKDRTTDDEILDWVRRAAETTYHPVGTCRMGADALAVVDARLRVHGIEGLRVADASIMPTLTSGNTNAPAIMIGEKAADMVLQDA